MTEKISKNEDLDQGFNDDELADIMSEIENLEKEFVNDGLVERDERPVENLKIDTREAQIKKTNLQAEIDNEVESLLGGNHVEVKTPAAKKPSPQVDTPVVSPGEVKDDNLLATSSPDIEKNVEVETPISEGKVMDNVVALKNVRSEVVEKSAPPTSINQTQLDFSVAGQMNLKLNFTVAGQTISLYVNETDGMVIEMMGGARFTLPMGEVSAKKKAA